MMEEVVYYATQSRANAHNIDRKMLHGKTKSVCNIIPSDSSGCNSSHRYYRLSFILSGIALAGCTSLKKAALIGGGSLGAGAIASIATSGSAPVLLAAAGGASVTSVVADVMNPETGGTTLNSCVEPNFFSVVQQLVESGGWLLTLVILVPMVLGWILPGPLERRKKK
jgi:hypothetical protein